MPNVGIARLQVAERGGRSVVTQQFGKAPLQVHRPLYLDESGQPTVYLKTPSAGLLAGDEHEISVHIEPGASLKLCTQACTLIYPGASRQTVDIRIGDGGTFIFQPHALILARDAEFVQRIAITLGANCNLLFSDYWCAGRLAMNEKWQFKRFENTVTIQVAVESDNSSVAVESDVYRLSTIYREHWSLEPAKVHAEHPLLCGEFTHFQNTYSCGDLRQSNGLDERQGRGVSGVTVNSKQLHEQPERIWDISRDGYNIRRICAKAVIS
ncbi:MAG TPA: urease accessory protein UreD [Drouetiella sp.]